MAGDVARKELRARVGAMPWAVRLQLRALEAAVDATQRRDGTVNRFLFSLLVDRQAPANPARADAGGVCSVDVTVDASTGARARVYFATGVAGAEADSSPRPVIVYFHGGGFMVFSAATRPYDALCRTMCRETGAVVVSVTYRLAPEHRYPAAYDDGEAALRYLATTGLPAEVPVRVDLSRCFLAGANIALHVVQRWTAAPPTTPPAIHLAGLLLLSAYFGGEDRTESEQALEGVAPIVNLRWSDFWWKAFLPEGADRNHPAAHVTGEAGTEPELPEAFPPAMVVVGGLDPLQDWGRRGTPPCCAGRARRCAWWSSRRLYTPSTSFRRCPRPASSSRRSGRSWRALRRARPPRELETMITTTRRGFRTCLSLLMLSCWLIAYFTVEVAASSRVC